VCADGARDGDRTTTMTMMMMMMMMMMMTTMTRWTYLLEGGEDALAQADHERVVEPL
jgi:hypothetical protein